jgi:hypothetical protein
MKRALLIALTCLATAGCGYLERRWNDWTDVSTLSVGLGGQLSVQMGELVHLGIGGAYTVPWSPILPPVPFLYHLLYGDVASETELWWPVNLWLAQEHGVPVGLHTVNYRSLYPREPVATQDALHQNPALWHATGAPPEHECWLAAPFLWHRDPVPTMLKDYFALEISLILLIGAKLRFNIVELADFLTGWIPGMDLLGDDHLVDRVRLGPYWYKHVHPRDYAPIQPREHPDAVAEPGIGR